jgi:hypothetical protein
MKLNIKPMDLVGDIIKISAVLSIIGSVVYSTGWIISRSQAGEMIQVSVAQSAAAIYQEALDRERADLIFQKEMTSQKMQLLAAKPDRNDYDDLVLQGYVDELKSLDARLAAIDAPKEPQ